MIYFVTWEILREKMLMLTFCVFTFRVSLVLNFQCTYMHSCVLMSDCVAVLCMCCLTVLQFQWGSYSVTLTTFIEVLLLLLLLLISHNLSPDTYLCNILSNLFIFVESIRCYGIFNEDTKHPFYHLKDKWHHTRLSWLYTVLWSVLPCSTVMKNVYQCVRNARIYKYWLVYLFEVFGVCSFTLHAAHLLKF